VAFPEKTERIVEMFHHVIQGDDIEMVIRIVLVLKDSAMDGHALEPGMGHGCGIHINPFHLPTQVLEPGEQGTASTTDIEQPSPPSSL
jgi:hypothetical protein